MEILEIKQQLEITEVAGQLGIEIGKGEKALCPFHNDKTPSLQFSKEKQIALQPTPVNYKLCVRIFELSKNKTVIN
jgi:hypothetical protein